MFGQLIKGDDVLEKIATTATEPGDRPVKRMNIESIKIVSETKLIPDDVMTTVAVNMLTEAGVAPGLESEMAEYALSAPEGDDPDDDEERRAAATLVVDAAPRSLYVRRDVQNVSEIAAWARAQGITDLRDDLHVTIVHSSQAFDWIKAGMKPGKW